jgi:DNA-binding transcriptional ArsR family regulator
MTTTKGALRARRKAAPTARAAARASATRAIPEPAALAAIFRALGDETRLEILERLARADESLCVCDLECCFDLSQPTISHHVRVLRDASLVKCERRGTWVHCAIDGNALERIEAFTKRLAPSSRRTKGGRK